MGTNRIAIRQLLPKLAVDHFQHFELGAPDTAVIDQLRFAQGLQTVLELVVVHQLTSCIAALEFLDGFNIEI